MQLLVSIEKLNFNCCIVWDFSLLRSWKIAFQIKQTIYTISYEIFDFQENQFRAIKDVYDHLST